MGNLGIFGVGCTVVLLATLLVYLGTLRNGWVDWDDYQAILENTSVTSFDLAALLKGATGNAIYAPVTWITFAALGRLTGFSAAWFHAFDLALHLFSTAAVLALSFILARSFFTRHRAVAIALATGLLFGIHPVQVEAVAWATARKDTLSTCFFLLALLSYLKPSLALRTQPDLVLQPPKNSPKMASFQGCHGTTTTLLYALALLSKPNTVVFPLVALGYDWLAKGRLTFGDFARKGLWLGMAMATGLVNIVFQSSASIWQASELSLASSLGNAITALAIYLQKIIAPHPLAITYGHPALRLGGLEWIAAAAVIGLVSFAVIRERTARPLLAFAGFFFMVTLIPVLRMVPFGNSFSLVHDRFLYLPSVGGFFSIAAAASCALEPLPLQSKPFGRTVGVSMAAMATSYVIWLGTKTIQQVATWRNSETLWTNVLHVNPLVIIAHTSLGTHALSEQRPRDALRYFESATKLPGAKTYTRTILTNQAIAHGMLGDHKQASTVLQDLLKQDPSDSTALTNLGISYFQLRKLPEAKAALENSLKLKQEDPRTHHNLGLVHLALGNPHLARRAFDAALALDPNFAPALRERNAMSPKTQQRSPSAAPPTDTEPVHNVIHP